MSNLCDSCVKERATCGVTLTPGALKGDPVVWCNIYKTVPKCTWSNSENAIDEDVDTHWLTSCGEDFLLNEGTPDSNGMDYCCYCGKTIDQLVEE